VFITWLSIFFFNFVNHEKVTSCMYMAYIIKLPCYLGLCTILSLGCAANVRLLRVNVKEFKMEAQKLEN
jgi:hypothetical protein